MRLPRVMPDLDLPPQQAVIVSCGLVPLGRAVFEGDRLLELAAGEVTVDLPAPTTGRVVQKSAAEGEIVAVDHVLLRRKGQALLALLAPINAGSNATTRLGLGPTLGPGTSRQDQTVPTTAASERPFLSKPAGAAR